MTSKIPLEAKVEMRREDCRESVGSILSSKYFIGLFGVSSSIFDFGNRRPLRATPKVSKEKRSNVRRRGKSIYLTP